MHFLQKSIDVPPLFGTFHLVAIAFVLALILFLCVFFRDAKDKTYRIILFVIWIVMVVMEALKQFSKCYVISNDGSIVWGYNWGTFPFQLCDGPLYLLLPIALLPDGKLRDAFSLYSATYLLLGGITTYIIADSVLCSNLYVNIQTLTHHGLQIVSGVFIAVYNRKRFTLKSFGYAFLVFVVAVAIACILNYTLHQRFPDQNINMFYISPYFKKTLPIFNEEWKNLHWALTIAVYLVGVTILAFLLYSIYLLLVRITRSDKTEPDGDPSLKEEPCE